MQVSNIIFIADVHIKLGQKNVPKKWQLSRIKALTEELVVAKDTHAADTLIIGGDLLDTPKPSLEELSACFEFLYALSEAYATVVLYPGNHEATSKTKSIYRDLKPMLKADNVHWIEEPYRSPEFDIIPYTELHSKWKPAQSNICFTHVRGAIPPHVEPEVDLSRFADYDVVFTGDLHSYKNSQENLQYPGSPYTTSFHREEVTGSNGYFFINLREGNYEWYELLLPQLIRRTVECLDEVVPTDFHHTVYELCGDLDSLGEVDTKDHELLDKKVVNNVSSEATLELQDSLSQNLHEYLVKVKGLNEQHVARLLSVFSGYYND